MIQLEIDGKSIEVPEGTMLMEAAKEAGQYVPHFCYHKKLSIAANCRMCLVEVEKAPKPLPACATPVTAGMKVFTHSQKAKDAQKSVMEFLLVNHPLDCPICDQGGECQLQDLAVGYGGMKSRYQEEKRVVFHKNVGSLISMEEMSRCIHCTRCVRFGQEIAGIMEFGMLGRGEHSEITSFVGKTINSELSGNMIDLCPVGALTSKPFRYSARTWELTRRTGISSHDALGSNLVVQIKNGKVMRVLPQENEDINECWISDKDRFSYEGLYHHSRLQSPILKDDNGLWHEVEWSYALQTIKNKFNDVKTVAGLFNSQHTSEEIHSFKKLLNGLGSDIIDFRLKHGDLNNDENQTSIALNNVKISDFSNTDRYNQITFIGSFFRNDHPVLCARVRKSSKSGMGINSINASSAQDWLMPIQQDTVIAPHLWVKFLTQVKNFIFENNLVVTNLSADLLTQAQDLANLLIENKEKQIIALGANVIYHNNRGILHNLCNQISQKLACNLVVLPDSSNMISAYQIGAYTSKSYTNLDAYMLMGIDLENDINHINSIKSSLKQAKTVIALSSYTSTALLEYADVILPIATSFETSGTFVNMQGNAQGFYGVSKPVGLSRPAWKVLKVIADTLDVGGFDYESTEDIKKQINFDFASYLSKLNQSASDIDTEKTVKYHEPVHFERISYSPIYHTDAVVRHSASLQKTELAKKAKHIYAHPTVMQDKGLKDGDLVTILQGQAMVNANIYADKLLSNKVILIPTACEASKDLDGLYGDIAIEKASV
ncbi:MAG: hypothetical protein RLZZ210_707 [Pseudomonadota bacterium]